MLIKLMENNKQNKYKNPFVATLTGIREIFRKQKPDCFLDPGDRLDGKTVLIDGASSGLGFAVAVEVARRGAKVIMACRSGIPGKGEEVKKLSGNNNVFMLPVDFSDLQSIQHLASCIQHQYSPIDIYICNAAVVPLESRKTVQGLEEMFMVNYFSKFLFINMLIENGCMHSISHKVTGSQSHRVTESLAPTPHPTPNWGRGRGKGLPRIVIVSSESHRNPKEFDWEGFGRYKEYGIQKTVELYGYYKLLLTTFAIELSRRLNPDGEKNFSVFSLCPGPINSGIAREAPGLFQPLLKLVFTLFFRSPEKAAVPVIYLASSKEQEGKSFDYLFLMNRKDIDELASDPENGKKLWEVSEVLKRQLS
jgi:NAD(P)-dependent dehydrogenase (short-subunit alcohol dehydrogenase family)